MVGDGWVEFGGHKAADVVCLEGGKFACAHGKGSRAQKALLQGPSSYFPRLFSEFL
jgi:hypothetical protein